MTGRVEISPNAESQAAFVADWLIDRVNGLNGDVRLVLAGGNTPRRLYALLSDRPRRRRMPWRRLQLYWGDERFVPHDDPASNYGMAYGALLANVPVPPDQIHPMPVEDTPEAASAQYEALLKQDYGAETLDPARPLFDILLLGLGGDGHTCSLFPGSPALDEQTRWVTAVDHGRPEPRISLTYPAIASSRFVAFLVSGIEKQEALLRVLAGDMTLPAARVRSAGEIVWFVDRAAAGPLFNP